jgi:hypothetical protein
MSNFETMLRCDSASMKEGKEWCHPVMGHHPGSWDVLLVWVQSHAAMWPVGPCRSMVQRIFGSAKSMFVTEFEKFTISWLVPASLYTHNKLAASFPNQMQYLWPHGMANWSIIDILQGPQLHLRLGHTLDCLFTIPNTHKYYNILQESCIAFRTKKFCKHFPNWWLSIEQLSSFSDDCPLNRYSHWDAEYNMIILHYGKKII